jgi:hypothetical protein
MSSNYDDLFMNPENLNDITLIRYIMETAEYTAWDEIEKK